MGEWAFDSVAAVLVAITTAGCLYALGAAVLVRRFAVAPVLPVTSQHPPVTMLKPVHGADAALGEDLAACCQQHYAGPLQVIFGVQSESDAAVAVVKQLMVAFPDKDLHLSIAAHASYGNPQQGNPKVWSLIHMQRAIRHDHLVISDADIVVDRNYLARIMSLLQQPGVGLVTCLYHGIAAPTLWARLGAMGIDYHFLPSVLVGARLGLAQPCFGSTIALERATLERIGGFAAASRTLADDYALGRAVRTTGLRVVFAPFLVGHRCGERSAAALLQHELRWARTIRTIDPAGFAGSVLTHPLPFALGTGLFTGFGWLGSAAIAAALISRWVLMAQVDRTLGKRRGRAWLGPVRDLLSFFILAASFFGQRVRWQGSRYAVDSHGTIQ